MTDQLPGTVAEQFTIINDPDWLTAFRTKTDQVVTALTDLQTKVTGFSFDVNGVPCCVELLSPTEAIAHIGNDDSGNWLYNIKAPAGWFRPPPAPPIASKKLKSNG